MVSIVEIVSSAIIDLDKLSSQALSKKHDLQKYAGCEL